MFVVDNLCAICENGLEEPVLLNCDHRLCRICFTQWEATNAKCCPRCRTKLRRSDDKHAAGKLEQEHSSGSSRHSVSLPGLPLPDPHAGLLVLYHGGDEATPISSEEPGFCNLRCYVEDTSSSRRFMYCGNCDTAFHRLNYKLPTNDPRSPRSIGISAPMTQMIKHQTSRTNLQNESRHRHLRNTEIHEQLLAHAVHCQEAICGYSTCRLMKNYLRLADRHPRKRLCVDLAISPGDQRREGCVTRSLPNRTAVSTTRSTSAPTANTSLVSCTASARPSTAVFASTASPLAAAAAAASAAAVQEEMEATQELARREDDISRAVGLSRGCRYCIRAANILSLHEQMCSNSAHCGVRLCAELKYQHLRTP